MLKKSRIATVTATLDIPEDLWYEVFLKLPVRDVASCRRLSKFHRDLIDSTDFIGKHAKVSTKTTHVLLRRAFDTVHRLDSKDLTTIHELNSPTHENNRDPVVEDFCMGILCYYHLPYNEGPILWNPFTGCSRRISHKPVNNCRYVMGHDTETDDLKVFKIETGVSSKVFVEIYSSKTDSWTELCMDDHDGHGSLPVFVEGTNSMHWLHSNGAILAYNFSTEKFSKFLQPTEGPHQGHPIFLQGMTSLDGCLCYYFNYPSSDRKLHFDVWTMKEYGVEKSWTRLFAIVDFPDWNVSTSLKPLVLLNNRRQLVLIHPTHGLYLTDDVEAANSTHTTQLKMKLDFFMSFSAIESIKAFLCTPTLRKP